MLEQNIEQNKVYDAAIVGAGPAGVSCAVWLARLGLAPVLLDAAAEVGGLCRRNPFPEDWNASLPGVSGAQVADNLARSLELAGVPLRLSCRVHSIRRETGPRAGQEAGREAGQQTGQQPGEPAGEQVWQGGAAFKVACGADSTLLSCRHVVLASGVRARGLARAELAPAGRILTGPGEHIVAQDFRGLRVAVLGGGDNAFENALYVAERGAASVRVHARSVRAQQQFVRRLAPSQLAVGPYTVDPASLSVDGRVYDMLLVFYGWEPCVDFTEGLDLRRTPAGFVASDAATAQTSCDGVYAIGEVTQRQHPCVVTALADGVTAAKAIQARIEHAGRPWVEWGSSSVGPEASWTPHTSFT
ncbi:NAD(P)/FAD-dependent oxidoreductase [Candidimonas nitroreducens]|uniref:Oxidoreductase n=1 Tax=Candidimonas nitroreducens TaxID=683354 RepID=A0A225MDA6_9BURK|nr:NAD(P)/FAD-dependent oxidoreductase [Candidimonas nitroreducens]OWT59158.1 oxidoreductase [Candidimonas nitroreducens]